MNYIAEFYNRAARSIAQQIIEAETMEEAAGIAEGYSTANMRLVNIEPASRERGLA